MFSDIKKIFGFSDQVVESDADDELSGYDDLQQRTPYINPFKKPEVEPVAVNGQPTVSVADTSKVTDQTITATAVDTDKVELPDGFLDSVIEIVNANLPKIVKDSIDIDVEKKMLTNAIGEHFRSAMNTVRQKAEQDAIAKWNTERAAFTEKIDTLTAAADESEKRMGEIRQRLHLEEAKRKNLAEQTETLQNRIQTLEAEQEQYMIESKSLQNKMKVMSLHAEDLQTYQEQLKEKDTVIAGLKAKISELGDSLAPLKEQNAKLQEALDDANTGLELATELQKQLEQVDVFKTKKNKEIKQLKEQIEEISGEKDSLTAEVERCKAETARLEKALEDAKKASEQTQKSTIDFNDEDVIDNDIKDAVSETFGIALSTEPESDPKQAPSPASKPVSEPEPKSASELATKPSPAPTPEPVVEPAAIAEPTVADEPFSDVNIEATFEPIASASEPETDYANTTIVSAIDEIDDIDWLMPTPPTPEPPVQIDLTEPEISDKGKSKEQPNMSQMSLF